jgi:hypothetical protein
VRRFDHVIAQIRSADSKFVQVSQRKLSKYVADDTFGAQGLADNRPRDDAAATTEANHT